MSDNKIAYISDYDGTLVNSGNPSDKMKQYSNLLARVVKDKLADKVIVLTARDKSKTDDIQEHLKSLGIADAVGIIATGSADPIKKADYIESCIKEGYNTIIFLDNSEDNLVAVSKLQDKYPQTKLIVHKV